MSLINENPDLTKLPSRPFDGQIFIDFYGVEWIYESKIDTWRNNGKKSTIPVASDQAIGLLDKSLKQTIDSIPEKGGGFGIIVKPLLSVKPYNVKPLFSDKIFRKSKTEFGTTIFGEKPFVANNGQYNLYVENKMAGLLLQMKTGKLKGKQFLVFGNDQGKIFVDGDLSSAAVGETFELYDPVELNPDGILTGNIELVSDSLDISCVATSTDNTIVDDTCNKKPTDVVPPSGLQFKLKEKLLNTLCIEIPGCKGPKGERGDKGETGTDGTGDGPQGDTGPDGLDATSIGTFSGIKVIESDDVFDTAVVALEPDPDLGKLYVVKAKIKAPASGTPADQVIASAINRSVSFEEEFFFKINKPVLDSIQANGGSGIPVTSAEGGNCFIKSDFENDVIITVCPNGSAVNGQAQVGVRWLSDYLNEIAEYYREKLSDALQKWDDQAETIIKQKDQEARQVICTLAQQLAECEWELPLEFCVALSKGDCATPEESTSSFPLAAAIFGDENYNADSNPKIQLVAMSYVLGGEGKQWPETPIVVRLDNKNASGLEVNSRGEITDSNVTTSLPAGDYILLWDSGSIRDYDYPHLGNFVGGWMPGPAAASSIPYGVKVKIRQVDGTETIENFPVPDILQSVKVTKTGPLGAYCVKIPSGSPNSGNGEYFCDIKPFLSNPTPAWIEGAFAGYWTPGDTTEFNGINQVPPPGTQGPGYIQRRSEWDAIQVEEAYRKAALDKKAVTFTIDESGGKVTLLCPILGGGKEPQFSNRSQSKDKCISGENVIKFRLYRVFNSNNAVYF